MIVTRTVTKYAEALYELAAERGRTEAVGQQLERLQTAASDNPELIRLLGHPSIDGDDKLRVVMSALDGEPDKLVRDFVRLLLERGQPEVLVSAATAYQMAADERAGVIPARVETVVPLDPSQRQRLQAALARLAGRQVRLEVEIRPELIGGVRVRLGDRLLDGSLKGRLQRMAWAVGGNPKAQLTVGGH